MLKVSDEELEHDGRLDDDSPAAIIAAMRDCTTAERAP